MRLAVLAAAAAIMAAAAPDSWACRVSNIDTVYWSAPPADLRADEVALKVERIDRSGESAGHPGSPLMTTFRVDRTQPREPENPPTVHVNLEDICNTVTAPRLDRPAFIVGRLIPRLGRTPLLEPRTRSCTHMPPDAPDRWACAWRQE